MDCSCLEDQPIEDDSFWPRRRDAKLLLDPLRRFVSGFCPNDCSNLMVFIAVTTGAKFISTLPRVGSMLVSLRCVDPADKALAIGFTSFVLNILAYVPYPLIYGYLIDSTCLVWGTRGDRQGNCWYYDNNTLRNLYLGATIVFYFVGTICMIMMAYYAKNITGMYGDEEEGNAKLGGAYLNQDAVSANIQTRVRITVTGHTQLKSKKTNENYKLTPDNDDADERQKMLSS